MITLTSIVLLLYAELIIWAYRGISRLKPLDFTSDVNQLKATIIIPFRNEAQRLGPLLESIKRLPATGTIELLFMDDSSEDESVGLIRAALEDSEADYQILKVIRESVATKKDAITQGVKAAKHPWIITLDADVSLPDSWWNLMQKGLAQNPDLLLGPIALASENTLLNWLQQIETAGITQLGRGSAGFDRPMVANGAHLAYSKAWFTAVGGFYGNLDIASGDDMFMLKKAVNSKAEILYLNSKEATLTVAGASSWPEYFWQRIRWIKKSQAVGLQNANRMGLVVTLANLWIIVLLASTFFDSKFWWILGGYFSIKICCDVWLLAYQKLDSSQNLLLKTIVANLVYPWTLIIILLRATSGSYRWKGREYKK